MKNRKIRIVKAIIFLFLLITEFTLLTYLFRNADNYRATVTGIKSVETPIDVVVVGGSECMTYYQPLRAYEEFGVASYNMSTDGLPTEAVRYYVEHANSYVHNKVVVVGVRTMLNWYGEIDEGYIRNASDSFDLFSNCRFRLLNEYLNKRKSRDGKEVDVLSYFLDIAYYHDKKGVFSSSANWSFIDNKGFSYDMGYERHSAVQNCERPSGEEFTDNKADIHPNIIEMADSIISYCNDEGIELCFVVTPFCVTEDVLSRYNTFKEYVMGRGCVYLDMNEYYDDIGLDFSQDFYNGYHVNAGGAEKVTRFLSSYLKEQYNLSDRRNEDTEYWQPLLERFDRAEAEAQTQIKNNKQEEISLWEEANSLNRIDDVDSWIECVVKNPQLYCCIAVDAGAEVPEGMSKMGLTSLENMMLPSFFISSGDTIQKSSLEGKDDDAFEFPIRSPYHDLKMEENEYGRISIIIDGKNYAAEGQGVHIVVYDYNFVGVVDSVCFTTWEDGSIHIKRDDAQ